MILLRDPWQLPVQSLQIAGQIILAVSLMKDIDQQIESVTQWELDPGCRMAYVNQTLYINGERIGDQTPSELLHLANTRTVQSGDIRKLQGLWLDTIIELIRTESLLPTEDDGS